MNKLQRILLVSLIAALCIGGVVYYFKTQVRMEYGARTKFQILPPSSSETPGNPASQGADADSNNWLSGEVAILSSRENLTQVVQVLDLDSEWSLSEEEALSRLEKQITVTLDDETKIVNVAVLSDCPNLAADIANTVRTTYTGLRQKREEERFRKALLDIETQIKAQEKKVDAERAEMEALQKKHGIKTS